MGGIVSTFAAAVMRGKSGWMASEVELAGLTDIDEVVDQLQDADPDADLALLFVESDDQYLVILRLDDDEDPRVFGSDSAFAEESRIGALLLGEIEPPALEIDDLAPPVVGDEPDDEEEEPATDPDADPVGDVELLADLGISGQRLLALCSREGMLPSDITTEITQRLGCGDELDELREA